MAVKFQDYYEVLGVSRGASQDELQRAYRKLARQYHPDVNKEAAAEARFKQINEAYEVLKDPERRKRYDQLGADYKAGQDFTPPPGWEQFRTNFGGGGGGGIGGGRRSTRGRAGHRRSGADAGGFEGFGSMGGSGGFSDFFEAIFGGRAGGVGGGGGFGDVDFENARSYSRGPSAGPSHEAELTITLEDAYRGGSRRVSLETTEPDEHGRTRRTTKNYDVRIPAGTTDGSVIRLAGQGGAGSGGGPSGDLLLRIRLAPDPRFKVEGHNLTAMLPISPWEAALGAKVPAPTIDGEVTLTIPPGSQTGNRLRLRGKGLPQKGGERGDQFVELRIVVPKELSLSEREAFERLRDATNFDPRRA